MTALYLSKSFIKLEKFNFLYYIGMDEKCDDPSKKCEREHP